MTYVTSEYIGTLGRFPNPKLCGFSIKQRGKGKRAVSKLYKTAG